MAGYRFCRSDDIPLLVAAHNACWVPHFGPEHAITVEDFRRGVRELGLWASSCMVAFDGDEPIGVLIGAKRDGEANCVHRLAVKPGWERRGHGRHLLTSLAEKAAILGPPRLVAEIPAAWAEVRAFFERSGFAPEETYADFVLDPTPVAAPVDSATAASLVVPIALEDLVESGAFAGCGKRAWARGLASLRARASELTGWAIATDRLEAHVLFRTARDGAACEVMSLGIATDADERWLGLLLERLRADGRRVEIPRIAEWEANVAMLAALGFRRERAAIGYVAVRAA